MVTLHNLEWVRSNIERILTFYHPECIDTTHGGYIAQFDEESDKIYDTQS